MLHASARQHVVVTILAACFTQTVLGQQQIYQNSTPSHQRTSAFIDPLEFNPDFQIFKPFDAHEYSYGKQPRVRTGWHAAFDRLYLAVTRPATGGTHASMPVVTEVRFIPPPATPVIEEVPLEDIYISQLADTRDFAYANQFDIGHMNEAGHGWFVSFIDTGSPNAFADFHPAAIIYYEEEDDDDTAEPLDDEEQPPQFSDASGTEVGKVNPMRISLNDCDYWGVEVNRSFRLQPINDHLILEPFLGLKYANFKDYSTADLFDRSVYLLPDPSQAGEGDSMLEVVEDRYAFYHSMVINEMFGPQLGFRAHYRNRRWIISTEARAFVMHNWQFFTRHGRTDMMMIDEEEEDTQEDGGIEITERTNMHDEFDLNELVTGGELRVQVAYELTRDFAIRAGIDVKQFGRGIARGFDAENNEHVFMIGATFGVTLNR
ncbi:MAG: hypothetical protein CMJ81_21695 [Planctomycetaceae bacterium]|nr:hypothetical protein [Planctomycetaceae bacterium]